MHVWDLSDHVISFVKILTKRNFDQEYISEIAYLRWAMNHPNHDHDETFREHSHLSTDLQKIHNLAKNIEKNQTHHLFYQVVLWECLEIILTEGLQLKMIHLN